MKLIKKMLTIFLRLNRKILFASKAKHSMNGYILFRTGDALYKTHHEVYNEVCEYCKNNGLEVQKIMLITTFSSDVMDVYNEVKSSSVNISMKSESLINVVEEDGKLIAVVYMDSRYQVTKQKPHYKIHYDINDIKRVEQPDNEQKDK
jgi:hypothetical protein